MFSMPLSWSIQSFRLTKPSARSVSCTVIWPHDMQSSTLPFMTSLVFSWLHLNVLFQLDTQVNHGFFYVEIADSQQTWTMLRCSYQSARVGILKKDTVLLGQRQTLRRNASWQNFIFVQRSSNKTDEGRQEMSTQKCEQNKNSSEEKKATKKNKRWPQQITSKVSWKYFTETV